jgi:succinoglycan biosynthesis transport protein ExoP
MAPEDDRDVYDPLHLPAAGRRPQPLAPQSNRQLVVDLKAADDPQEAATNFLDYWHVLVKWRWVIVGAMIAAAALGMGVTLLMTPVYRATATLQIDREAAKVVAVESQAPSEMMNAEEFYQTQYGLLKSRTLAERVVSRLNLASDPDFLNQRRGGLLRFLDRGKDDKLTGDVASRNRRAASILMHHLKIEPVRNSRLVKISYDSPNARTSSRVINALADNFIASGLERRFEASTYARSFLEDRLRQLKQKLEESERQLVAYAASQQIINVSDGDTGANGVSSPGQSLTSSSLVALNGALAQAKGERIRAETHWRQAQSSSGMGLPEILQSSTIQTLQSRRTQLQSDYQDKLKIYKPEFPAMTQIKAQIDETDRQMQAEIATIKDSVRAQYEVALRQERSLEGQVGGLKSSVLDLRSRSIQYNIIQREVDTNRSLYDGLLQRYKEIGVAGGVGTNNISIVDAAETPIGPYQPKPLINLGASLLLGLVLGVVLAFGLEYLDDSIKVPEDVETKLGVPLLGSIPNLEKGVTSREALADGRSGFSEAYYSVRTALQFSTDTGVPRSLLITSARPSEGKSTTALALAHNFARLGMRVLLIDGDLRNPSLHHHLSCDNSAGFSNYLIGASALFDVLQSTDQANLVFLPCGPLPPNPAELLAGGKVRTLLAKAEEQFDLVIIDGPPIMGLADAPLLASVAGGTVMVVEAATTRRGLARAALRRLQIGHARILGAVLTKFNIRKAGYGYAYGYGYSYAYSYGQGPGDEPRLENKR